VGGGGGDYFGGESKMGGATKDKGKCVFPLVDPLNLGGNVRDESEGEKSHS